MSEEEEIQEVIDEKIEPLEVKVIKEKEEIVNDDIELEEQGISKEEIEDFEKGD